MQLMVVYFYSNKNQLIILIIFIFIPENRQIPTDLRKDALAIQKTLDWKDDGGEGNVHSCLTC